MKVERSLRPLGNTVIHPKSADPQEASFTVANNPALDFKTAGATIVVIFTVLTFVYLNMLPDKIEVSIANSKSLAGLTQGTQNIQKGLDELKISLNEILPLLSPLKDPRLIIETLKNTTALDSSALVAELPNARKLLSVLRASKGRVPPTAYREIAVPLKKTYESTKQQELRDEIWRTFIDLASTKSTTDARIYTLPEAEVKRAKEAGKFIEGVKIDLSEKREWKDTIFTHCSITITKPNQGLKLDRVRFVEVDFQAIPQNVASNDLLTVVIDSDSPTVSKQVVPEVNVIFKRRGIAGTQISANDARSARFLTARHR